MKMKIGIISLVSDIHNRGVIMDELGKIRDRLSEFLEVKEIDISAVATVDLVAVLIGTGGTEHMFKAIFPQLKGSGKPVTLISTNYHNSLPASLEILYWLKQQGVENMVLLHGPVEGMVAEIKMRECLAEVDKKLKQLKIGMIGSSSDWLIASEVDKEGVMDKWGVSFVDIPVQELVNSRELFSLQEINQALIDFSNADYTRGISGSGMMEAVRVYLGLEKIVNEYGIGALTLRCFDLLDSIKNTGCLALSRLNDQGIPAGCEGDIPALFTMIIYYFLTGQPSFMANPAQIQADGIVFTHCTVPTRLVASYGYQPHFESGLGVAIAGSFVEGPVTVSKIGGKKLDRFFSQDGEITAALANSNLCRTQVKVKLYQGEDYFLKAPLGNHHIIVPGHYSKQFHRIMEYFQVEEVKV